ncbi:hypothetical protein [Atlantibacter hermannii]|uniref:hypothetical protein n=1 Tax=Atlantibacter hermannii TaxID=565 RepID=UPI002898117F|nr:hypothetical protein [Atlantibacter hermannii]
MYKFNFHKWGVNIFASTKLLMILLCYGLLIWGGLDVTRHFSDNGKEDSVLIIGVSSLVLSFISSTYFVQRHLPEIRFAKFSINIISVLSLATAVLATISSFIVGEEKNTLRIIVYSILVIIFFALLFLDRKIYDKKNGEI